MTRATLICLLALSAFISAHAQEKAEVSTATKGPAEATAATPSATVKTVDRTPPLVKERVITASGFLVELKRAERKKKFLSLRQKADPAKDEENLWREPKSGRPMGFRLLQINF